MSTNSLYSRIEYLTKEIELLTKIQAKAYLDNALGHTDTKSEYNLNVYKLSNLKTDLAEAEKLLKHS